MDSNEAWWPQDFLFFLCHPFNIKPIQSGNTNRMRLKYVWRNHTMCKQSWNCFFILKKMHCEEPSAALSFYHVGRWVLCVISVGLGWHVSNCARLQQQSNCFWFYAHGSMLKEHFQFQRAPFKHLIRAPTNREMFTCCLPNRKCSFRVCWKSSREKQKERKEITVGLFRDSPWLSIYRDMIVG